jgi:tripartite-type tricarboxylate transporter receptor subunit TctC
MRTLRLVLLVFGVISSWAPEVRAQLQYPNRPVRIIVPHPPGGSTDVLVRIVAEKLQSHWGKPPPTVTR